MIQPLVGEVEANSHDNLPRPHIEDNLHDHSPESDNDQSKKRNKLPTVTTLALIIIPVSIVGAAIADFAFNSAILPTIIAVCCVIVVVKAAIDHDYQPLTEVKNIDVQGSSEKQQLPL